LVERLEDLIVDEILIMWKPSNGLGSLGVMEHILFVILL
jgi:hypothetical protein